MNVSNKFDQFRDNPLFTNLNATNKRFIEECSADYQLSVMDIRQILTIACDLEMWEEGYLEIFWPKNTPDKLMGKSRKQYALKKLYRAYNEKLYALKKYPDPFSINNGNNENNDGHRDEEKDERISSLRSVKKVPDYEIVEKKDDSTILGDCPVASEKTRCCNLKTMDAVINCGFGCNYCTIQPFYSQNNVFFHQDLMEKLDKLKLDPEEIYHIGTGQSSDSLMWGNRNNLLDNLFTFADNNRNVILELKTKAKLPSYMLEQPVPKNVITTWTLNGESIIRGEETGTASLEARIQGAEKMAAKGNITGFHFHPMVFYEGWEEEYRKAAEMVMNRVSPEKTAMVSIGTLTFIKPVIKQIRQQKLKTKILQMPLEEVAGKYSYPRDIKLKLFTTLYDFFKPWHGKVFFYMCMEPPDLWQPVFGREYPSNEVFEKEMKKAYMEKINRVASRTSATP